MRILILGDIHGRLIWSDIIQNESPDLTIFLGDYVSTHEFIPSDQQLSNLEDILNYKEKNLGKTILLRGNHDIQHLGYSWAECSGFDRKIYNFMSSTDFKNRFLKLTQWVYIDNSLKIAFSHAGISQVWMNRSGISDVHEINNMKPSEKFGFWPNSMYDMCGTSITQPPTWIRPETLCECNIIGYDQVVGHTPQRHVHKIVQSTKGKQAIWLCDTLANGEYLLIEDGMFIPKSTEII